MTVIALASAKGAPGVSTAALALALMWPRPVLLVDADPSGGDLLAGFYRGERPAGPGVVGATLAARRDPMTAAIWSQVLPLADGRRAWLLAGVSSPQQARSVDWQGLADALPGLERDGDPVDVLVDLGRLRSPTEATRPDSPGPEPLLRAADLVVLLLAGTLPAVRAAQLRVEQLQGMLPTGLSGSRLVCALAGKGRPYGATEIARELGVPVAATLPVDAGTAGTLLAGAPARRGWRRGPLMRAAATTAGLLEELAAVHAVQDVPPPAGIRAVAAPPTSVVTAPPASVPAERGWAPLPSAPSRGARR
ncbi:MAG: hypothetical protein ACR2JO_04360 [Mycobacteriales bacterium]